jgi:hypothetical protein
MHVFERRDIPGVSAMEMLVSEEPDGMTLIMESDDQCPECTDGLIALGREPDGAEITGLKSDPFSGEKFKQERIVADRLLCRQQHGVFI